MIQACDSHLSTEICFIADVDTTLARQSVFARLAGALRPQVQVGNSVAANYSSCSACCPRDAAHWDGHGAHGSHQRRLDAISATRESRRAVICCSKSSSPSGQARTRVLGWRYIFEELGAGCAMMGG